MKRLATIVIAGALTGILAAPAQTNFNLWLTTDGAGVQINSAPRPVCYPGFYYDGPCYHHDKKLRKRYKKLRKAHKKYIKAQKKYYKEMHKQRHRHHHHDDD